MWPHLISIPLPEEQDVTTDRKFISILMNETILMLTISSWHSDKVTDNEEIISPFEPGDTFCQLKAWCLFGAKPLPEPMLIYFHTEVKI